MINDCFTLKADLSDVVGDQKIISATIGPSGEACLLTVSPRDEGVALGREERKFAIFPHSRSKQSYAATFICLRDQVLQKTELVAVEQAFPKVQTLPNDEILLVGARCDFRNGSPEENGAVFDLYGNQIRRFVLGDGIQDLQTDERGMIWVSYFDEGVFGNFGWREPIGEAGLVCFDKEGRPVWNFEAPTGFQPIADCYAMNVASESVWACYHAEFTVVRIDAERKVQAWKNSVAGASAIAVSERRVALWGGYGEQRMRCVVLEREGDLELRNAKEVLLAFPRETGASSLSVTGRGATLHAFVGRQWYCWTME